MGKFPELGAEITSRDKCLKPAEGLVGQQLMIAWSLHQPLYTAITTQPAATACVQSRCVAFKQIICC